MIERTLIAKCPEVYDALLEYARVGQPNAMTYIPDVAHFEIDFVGAHYAAVVMVDDQNIPYTVEVPVDFATNVMEGRAYAINRLRKVLCAEWN